MLPDPLHPAVVHLPLALIVLLPLGVVWALWSIRRGAPVVRTWAVVVALQALLSGSAWLALSTGEGDEDRVERVVAAGVLEDHEESAERFLALSVVVLALAAAGLLRGRVGVAGRIAGAVGALALIAAGIQVGHSGGELVYRHGAAQAWVTGQAAAEEAGTAAPAAPAARAARDDDDGDELRK